MESLPTPLVNGLIQDTMRKKKFSVFNLQFSTFSFFSPHSLLFFLLCSLLAPLYSQVKFENPQINAESKYLFTVSHKLGGTVSYKTLF